MSGDVKNMKKKYTVITIILLMIILLFFDKRINYYCHYDIPNNDYFGEQYREILYPMSVSDKKQADKIMKKTDDAFSYIGKKEDAVRIYGKLSRYCITKENAVKERHDLKLITADFDETEGYLWIAYNQEAFDKNSQIIIGAVDVLARVTVKKKEQEWVVTEINEHP